ncbi:MAG TPA: type II toxin-antitoxin system prevent-host-death family antitoxin [Thermoanaerobaculia bacterium]|nr:type II toxin-antitoxin system prevent-host-death family antitoxin [Thermoanaerobaculia bacterium]
MLQLRHANGCIREARQELSRLLDEVRKGREVVITKQGRPVARLVSLKPQRFPNLKKLRQSRTTHPRLSEAVIEDREDRACEE